MKGIYACIFRPVERNSPFECLPKWVREEHNERFKFASQYVAKKEVVDCASGTGISSDIFLKAGAKSVIGVDINPSSVEWANANLARKGLEYRTGDGACLPLENDCCDIFISLETIEHVQNDIAFLKEAQRVLKKGGIFVCSTPNRRVSNPGATISSKPYNPFHLREYNLNEFEELLRRFFTITEQYGQNQIPRIQLGLTNFIAGVLGTHFATMIAKLFKCRWFFVTREDEHCVQKGDLETFEYFVFVAEKR